MPFGGWRSSSGKRHAEGYVALADKVESLLGLAGAKVPAAALGSIDTFRFEERALLSYCGGLIVSGRFDEALTIVAERERSFWLDRDVVRKAHWEACHLMAELGQEARAVRAALPAAGPSPEAWVDGYVREGGWHRLDLLQRRLESLMTSLDEDPDERALGVVRRAYEDAQHEMALGFTKALRGLGSLWGKAPPDAGLRRRRDAPAEAGGLPPRRRDAVRDGCGAGRAAAEGGRGPDLRPALSALPSITPVGTGVLMPGASGNFSVVEEGESSASASTGPSCPTWRRAGSTRSRGCRSSSTSRSTSF